MIICKSNSEAQAKGFPFCICASVNDDLVHGFPGSSKLDEGDNVIRSFEILTILPRLSSV